MVIINKSGTNKYSTVAHRNLAPGQKSADLDMGNFRKALSDVIKSCGRACCVRLNDEERRLVDTLLRLDDEGSRFRCRIARASAMTPLMLQEEHEKRQKMASIQAEQAREEAIRAETTYASRKDIDAANAKSSRIRGDIQAKPLAKDVTGTVSLNDLMGDNKFIEESMKHSNIPSAVASEEGWDMAKIQESQEKKVSEPAQETSSARSIPPESAVSKPTSKPRKGSRK